MTHFAERLIDKLMENDLIGAKDDFNRAISEKILTKLESKKIELAKRMVTNEGEAFKIGDKVKIKVNASKETMLGHKSVLGKSGKVVKDYGDGDLKVNFGGNDDRSVSSKDLVKESYDLDEAADTLSDIEKQALKSALGFGGAADPKYKKVIDKLKKMGYVKDIEFQKGIISPEEDTYYYNLTPKGRSVAMMKESVKSLDETMKRVNESTKEMTLWKFNPISGLWHSERKVTPETKDKWLEIFKKDEPKAKFVVSKNKPGSKAHLEEAKTNIYHKYMLKALGRSRLPKNHSYTSTIINGDFVVHDRFGNVAGRIPKGEHDLKEVYSDRLEEQSSLSRDEENALNQIVKILTKRNDGTKVVKDKNGFYHVKFKSVGKSSSHSGPYHSLKDVLHAMNTYLWK